MIKFKQPQQSYLSDESGFTIIESLIAIVVVAILLAAIAPVLVMSTATRVQSRRVELATQAAKTFIEGIRTGAITTAPTTVATLTAPTTAAPRNVSSSASDYLIDTTNMPAPTSGTKTTLYCYNKNGSISNPSDPGCTSDLFYIQAGRIVQSTGTNDGYRLGIRVYRADIDFTQTVKASAETKTTQNTFTGGLGDKQAPLLEMTTDIANSNTTFQALCQRLGTATNKSCN